MPLFSDHGVDLQQLKGETFILDQAYTFFNGLQQKILDYYQVSPGRILYCHSMSSIPRMVADGCGISFFPANLLPLAQTQCASFSLTPAWRFQYAVVYQKARGLNAYDGLLAQLFMEHYEQFRGGF